MCVSCSNYAKKFIILQENKESIKINLLHLHSWKLSELEFEPNYLYSVLTKLAVSKFRNIFLFLSLILVHWTQGTHYDSENA